MKLSSMVLGVGLLALTAGVDAALAQISATEDVRRVELVLGRAAAPPLLFMHTGEGRLAPTAGSYSRADRTTIVVKDGRIVGLSKPDAGAEPFQVVSADLVKPRYDTVAAKLYLKDAKGHRVVLPDGRFTSREGMTLVVRDGAIVKYGKSR